MKTVNQRVKETREAKGLSQSYVAKKVGLKQPTLSAFENGTGSTTVLPQIANVLGVSVDYLLTGRESIAKRDGQPINDIAFKGIEFWDGDTQLNDDEFEVPYYKDIELTGGAGSFEQYDDGRRKIKYGKSAARKSGASQTQSICMTLVGDSMEDRIAAGSMIAIDISKTEIREGKIYAFRHGQLLRVKYLIPRPDGGLIIRSHNKAYDDEIITASEAENELKVIGWVWNWSVLERW
ncbi:XRE family transcriptional regulator [Acinetobacter modestus]|uniref:XRE family transcriptional regulator n=1 Tax=Acinetobacter modestus TaxID=1776740 RepID=UPI00301612D5